jgi:Asp-tRNA(Asn)/Glu-tRNA(Gln) amidotransferase A subunit family amidase
MTISLPLARLSVTELAAAVARHEITVEEVARVTLDRINALDGDLRAWVQIDVDAVAADAQELDTESLAGTPRGPLHGVPIGIKDIYDVAGLPTRAGSKARAATAAAALDSAPVARLRAAGALIVGKTATTEFAAADPAETRNPFNLAHTPGGSSSGSAAAVAAGMVPAALGSQTAGSVLRPASFCGVVGFKPSFGRVERTGVVPFAWSLDTMGTLTRNVADAALLLGSLTPPSWQPAAVKASRPPRIGYAARILHQWQQPSMREALERATGSFARVGVRVEEASLPADFDTAVDAQQLIMLSEAATFHAPRFMSDAHLYGPRIRAMIEAGLTIPAVSYLQAQRVRRDLCERVLPLFSRFDALLVPAAPGPAPNTLESTGDPAFNAPWTMFGLPAITLCAGLDADGLPLGLQLVGAPRADEALLAVAAWCEQALEAAPNPPAPFAA